MQAEESLREGNLPEALSRLQEAVRGDPSSAKNRVFLFQLLSVLGDWERAMTQLNVAGDLDAGNLAMVQAYREALRCEVLRGEVFAGKRSPLVFGEPEQWVALVMEAVRLTADGRHEQARDLRAEAFEAAPVTSGSIISGSAAAAGDEAAPAAGDRFEWIADADSRLGPLLEALVNGKYYWIPFHRIQHIDIEEPADLRDVVWMPAHFRWVNGGEAVGMVPTRYAGTEASDDSLIRLARKTEWIEQCEGVYVGLGQRMLATDAGEFPLMDVRQVVLDTASDGEQGAAASDA